MENEEYDDLTKQYRLIAKMYIIASKIKEEHKWNWVKTLIETGFYIPDEEINENYNDETKS